MNRANLLCILILPLLATPAAAEPLAPDDPRIVAFETGLIDRMQRGQEDPGRHTIEARLESYGVPGVGVAIFENGEIVWQKGCGTKLAGTDDPVDADTVFSVGSVSKMVNAALVLRLVAQGRLDLDTDVNEYLESWKIPASRYNRDEAVTLRRILAHTVGFNVHGSADCQLGSLGTYCGFF